MCVRECVCTREGGDARGWFACSCCRTLTVLALTPACRPQVLLLAMLEPRSYTAEDVVEVHTHGGGLSAQRVLRRCVQAGARLAAAGEFTLRAFLNGRLDLSQAESVAQVQRDGLVVGWIFSLWVLCWAARWKAAVRQNRLPTAPALPLPRSCVQLIDARTVAAARR